MFSSISHPCRPPKGAKGTVLSRPAPRRLLVAALGAGLLGGCANNTETGMLVGGAGGAGVGAAIGSASGHAGTGALIGGAIGLVGGGIVGNSIDRQKEEEQRRAEEQRRFDAQYGGRAVSGGYTGGYAAPRPEPINQDDVIAWSRKGTSDEIIIDRIERGDSVFHLTAADEASLRDQGVSADVVRAMEGTEKR